MAMKSPADRRVHQSASPPAPRPPPAASHHEYAVRAPGACAIVTPGRSFRRRAASSTEAITR
jgi:hypothetical protein